LGCLGPEKNKLGNFIEVKAVSRQIMRMLKVDRDCFCFNTIGENAYFIVSLRWESKLLDATHKDSVADGLIGDNRSMPPTAIIKAKIQYPAVFPFSH
jgi:hypothetical protein